MATERAAGASHERFPPPPPGGSPTVAFVRAVPAQERLRASLVVIGVFAVLAAGFHFFRGLDWIPTLAIFGIGLIVVLRTGLRMTTSAGVDWLRVGDRWVDTTSLVDVKTYVNVNGMAIDLRDRDGRALHTRLSYLTDSQDVWRLFRAALQHSLRDGLEPNERTRRVLALGPPPGAARRR